MSRVDNSVAWFSSGWHQRQRVAGIWLSTSSSVRVCVWVLSRFSSTCRSSTLRCRLPDEHQDSEQIGMLDSQ